VLALWLEKFARHGNGIALVPERTSTAWWQDLVARADLILCVNKKIPFATPAGEQRTAFPIGSTLVAIGEEGVKGLLTAHRNGSGSCSNRFLWPNTSAIRSLRRLNETTDDASRL
jgi:hypothetical protein